MFDSLLKNPLPLNDEINSIYFFLTENVARGLLHIAVMVTEKNKALY